MLEEHLNCEKHESQIKTLFRKLDGMEWMQNTLTEISTLIKIMTEHNKKQDELNEKQNETLNNINLNLTELNTKTDTLNSRVGVLERKVEEDDEENFIRSSTIVKYVLFGILGAVISGIVATIIK